MLDGPDDRRRGDDPGRLRRQPALRRAARRDGLRPRRRGLGRSGARSSATRSAWSPGRALASPRSWRFCDPVRRTPTCNDLEADRELHASREADFYGAEPQGRHRQGRRRGRDQGVRPGVHRRRSRSRPSPGACTCTRPGGDLRVRRPAPRCRWARHRLSRDPRYPEITKTPALDRLRGRRLPGPRPALTAERLRGLYSHAMATVAAPRPAWNVAGRSLTRTRLLAPAGARGADRCSRSRCARRELGVGFWIDEGLSVGIADRPLADIPGVAAARRLAAAVLHAAARLDERLRDHGGGDPRAVAAVRAALDPGRVLGGARAVRHAGRLDGGGAGGDQPVPHAVRAGDAHVRAASRCWRSWPAARSGARSCSAASVRERRPWAIGLAVALAAMLYTHNWALFFVRRRAASSGSSCCAARRTTRRELLVDRADRVRRRAAAVPAVGADARSTRPPTPARHGRGAERRRPARLARRRWSASSCRSRCCSSPAPGFATLLARRGGRLSPAARAAACLLAIGVLTVRAGLAVLAGVARVGDPLPGGRRWRRCCSPPPRGLANAGRLGIAGADRRAALGRRHARRRQEQRARRRRGDRAQPAAGRPRGLHAARAGSGARTTTCRTGCATRRCGARSSDIGVTDWRDGVERLRRDDGAEGPQAAARPARARPAARARRARSSSTCGAGWRRGPSSSACARPSGASALQRLALRRRGRAPEDPLALWGPGQRDRAVRTDGAAARRRIYLCGPCARRRRAAR